MASLLQMGKLRLREEETCSRPHSFVVMLSRAPLEAGVCGSETPRPRKLWLHAASGEIKAQGRESSGCSELRLRSVRALCLDSESARLTRLADGWEESGVECGSTQVSQPAWGPILRRFIGSRGPTRPHPPPDLITAPGPVPWGPTHFVALPLPCPFPLLCLCSASSLWVSSPRGRGLVSSLQNYSDALDGFRSSPGHL